MNTDGAHILKQLPPMPNKLCTSGHHKFCTGLNIDNPPAIECGCNCHLIPLEHPPTIQDQIDAELLIEFFRIQDEMLSQTPEFGWLYKDREAGVVSARTMEAAFAEIREAELKPDSTNG